MTLPRNEYCGKNSCMERKPFVDFEAFENLDIRVGTVIDVQDFPRARKPAWRLKIDFGPAGILASSARITHRYNPETLLGRQVTALVNIPPRNVGGFQSECLVLGCYAVGEEVVLVAPHENVPNGTILC